MAGPGGFDINSLMSAAAQQADAMKRKMDAELKQKTVEGSTGGGMVKVTASGTGELRSISIDDSLYAPGEKDMLEDLLVAAVNVALKKARELQDEAQSGQMQNMMGGLGGLGGGGGGMPDLGALLGGLGGMPPR
ncbi:MAG: YbaB/EbfC family nucleoid-associated protein [Planctomycetota bacterium]